jgi:hypothetical protein
MLKLLHLSHYQGLEWRGRPGQQTRMGDKLGRKINILNGRKLISALNKLKITEMNVNKFSKRS